LVAEPAQIAGYGASSSLSQPAVIATELRIATTPVARFLRRATGGGDQGTGTIPLLCLADAGSS
jgi:hypothetical protein